MVTHCQVDRCNRCAMERGYSDLPELTHPLPRGWDAVVAELQRLGVPLVSFGQTIFWDEPSKAVLRLMLDQLAPDVLTLAGIHDSDYFSRLHGRERGREGFVLWSNNDWTHRDLWAAVGETTSLFGAETAPQVAELQASGVPLRQLAGPSPSDLDELLDAATTAYGWRGVAQLGCAEQIARDVRVEAAGPSLVELFEWGLQETTGLLAEPAARAAARARGEELVARLRAAVNSMPEATVGELYQRLIVDYYADLLGYRPPALDSTATVDYLRFNRETAARRRFQSVQAFLCHRVGPCARETYNRAIAGVGMYALDQFGEGAIPFDLVVPGRGRGTLRVLEREVRAELQPEPVVIPTSERVAYLEDLAELLEEALGPDIAIVGKALLGPVMFCGEAVLVLHDGASAYVPRTQQWLHQLNLACGSIRTYPILRLRQRAYDALGAAKVALRLPEHLAEAFGAEQLAADRFAGRWREVIAEQEALLAKLAAATSLTDLIAIIEVVQGGEWPELSQQLRQARATLREMGAAVHELRGRLSELRSQESELRTRRSSLERRSGELRAQEKATGDPAPRDALREELAALTAQIAACRDVRATLKADIRELTTAGAVVAARETIARIELRAQQERLAIARRALLTRSLELGDRRPTGWWFTVIDPSGGWFREAGRLAEVWLEDLCAPPEAE